MAIIVEQKPAFLATPANTELVFVINEDTGLLVNETYVKICCSITLSNFRNYASPIQAGEFKASPNGAGVCIFDLGGILESYVKPDYSGMNSLLPLANSTMQGNAYDENAYYHPVHCIDKYAYSGQSTKYFTITWEIEFLGGGGTAGVIEKNGMVAGSEGFIYNGVVYPTDTLVYPNVGFVDYGFDSSPYILKSTVGGAGSGGFITDAPKTQQATINDYGTLSFFNDFDDSTYSFTTGNNTLNPPTLDKITLTLYDSAGASLGTQDVSNRQADGGWSGLGSDIGTNQENKTKLLYCGLFPANLRGWSATFNANLANLSYYTIQAYDSNSDPMGDEYRINIIDECLYTPVRITWLNRLGTWDYYTFQKKSTRKLNTKRKTYTKLNGTWNAATFNINRQRGGQKNYDVSTQETITVNSDYMSEADSVWLEQLFTAQDMYIVKPYNTYVAGTVTNEFLEPVNLTNSSYKRKTKLNDKLIQYSFDFKRVTTRKTQRP